MKNQLFVFFFFLMALSSCSFDIEKNSSFALFSVGEVSNSPGGLVPGEVLDGLSPYKFACLRVEGPDGIYTSPAKQMLEQLNEAALVGFYVDFNIPKLWVGRKYSFFVIGFKDDPNQSDFRCPGKLSGNSGAKVLGKLENYLVPLRPGKIVIPVVDVGGETPEEGEEETPGPPPAGDAEFLSLTATHSYNPDDNSFQVNLNWSHSQSLTTPSYKVYRYTDSSKDCEPNIIGATSITNIDNTTVTDILEVFDSTTYYYCVVEEVSETAARVEVTLTPSLALSLIPGIFYGNKKFF